MTVAWWAWLAFLGFVVLMLLIDLLVFHREAHEVSTKEAAAWSGVWIALGLGFTVLVWLWGGATAAGEYVAGYLIEKSLSVDNLFVFAVIFSYFAVPAAYQHRVLFLGILGALVFRGLFIAGGAVLLARFHWMVYVFGGLLLLTGIRMARHRDETVRPEHNPVLRLVRRAVPMTSGYQDQRFFVRDGARRLATPMLAVLVVVETTDIIFAVDSIPAIFAVTRDPFLVFTSNAFAILGLRALYFLLAGMMTRFAHLRFGLALILVFVGSKMLISEFYKVPIWASLAVIGATLAIAIAASVPRAPRPAAGVPEPGLQTGGGREGSLARSRRVASGSTSPASSSTTP